jgi:UMF1 family MFS transporter
MALDHAGSGRSEVLSWALYAWAYHGFVTTVATVLFGPYLTDLAQAEVGENGPVFASPWLRSVTAKAYFFDCLSLSVFLQVLLLPLLGAITDFTNLKKRLLMLFSTISAAATMALFFVGAGLDFRWGGAVFAAANLAFGASVVLYNAFLPDLVGHGDRDRVSSLGYALGFLGGGLLLAANLVFMRLAPGLGVPSGLAVRLCLLSAGVWWLIFAVPAFVHLKVREPLRPLPAGESLMRLGLGQISGTLRYLRDRPMTRRFLIAYLLYNDGIQTVTSVAAVFLAQELFVAHGLAPDQSFLLGIMLMVQFIGVAGALFFGRLADRTSGKSALVFSLIVWCAVIIYGHAWLRTTTDAFGLSVFIALVLGGSQALSRSLFSRMIPKGAETSFFAIYEISGSGTSWIGPLIFAVVVAATNSYRDALLSLVALFLAGTALLTSTRIEQAFAEARTARQPWATASDGGMADANCGLIGG